MKALIILGAIVGISHRRGLRLGRQQSVAVGLVARVRRRPHRLHPHPLVGPHLDAGIARLAGTTPRPARDLNRFHSTR